MKAKQALDLLFKDYTFDTALYKKLVYNNIEFITTDSDHKHLFGSKIIGCFYLKYTIYDKNIFYNNVFGISYDDIAPTIDSISSINKSYKVARDDVNLVCFYMAHRFLSNNDLSKEKRVAYAKEALNYFNYRTLVLISSKYFIYPISEEKAISLSERLSNRYVIKKLKNWNEYCSYRSEEYLNNKFLPLLTKFNNDTELSEAISDLFNRTKDTLKNIYSEFVDMNENDDILKSRKNVVNDIEGEEVIVDRLYTPESYITKINGLLADKENFIKKLHIDVTVDIINSVSYKQLEEALTYSLDYAASGKDPHFRFIKLLREIIVNSMEYLQRNSLYFSNKANILLIVNSIVGNVLYARGAEIDISKLKSDGDKLIKDVYKFKKESITDRVIKNVRNALYVYVVLLALVD